ncbi:hypothetical protein D3C84_972690 [compost metagenome]
MLRTQSSDDLFEFGLAGGTNNLHPLGLLHRDVDTGRLVRADHAGPIANHQHTRHTGFGLIEVFRIAVTLLRIEAVELVAVSQFHVFLQGGHC